jgi:hypothetical protein
MPNTRPSEQLTRRESQALLERIPANEAAAMPSTATIARFRRECSGRPITFPDAPALMIDPRADADIIDPIDVADATERTEHAEPIDPMESTEPTDPIDKTEPRQPMHRTELSDQSDHFEFAPTPQI